MKTIELLLIVTVMAVAAAGCGSSALHEKQSFIPDVQRPAAATSIVRKDIALQVGDFTIDSAFRSKGLVYRKSDSQYVISYYTELMQTPADLLTDETRQWLAASGVCTVLRPGSIITPTHVLEGRIVQYYIDARDPKAPKAVIKVDFTLVKVSTDHMTADWRATCQGSQPLPQPTAEGAIAAIAASTSQVLQQVESGLVAVK
jgi:cholesterol transport system auxiliary component